MKGHNSYQSSAASLTSKMSWIPNIRVQRFFQQLLVNFRRIVSNVRHFGGAVFDHEWLFGGPWNNREPLLERGQGKLKETNFFNALKTPGKRKSCVSVLRCNVKLKTSKHKYIFATDSQEPIEPLSCVV